MKKKQKTGYKKVLRFFIFGVTSCLVIGAMLFTLGKYWIDILSKYKEKEFLEKELVRLQEKEAELKVDVEKLQDPDYVARYAREKYLYSKDGEFILKIPE